MQSLPGEGTSFLIYLPTLSEDRLTRIEVEREDLPQGQGETILLVEDNANTRHALLSSLEVLNYRGIEATNGSDALQAFEKHADEIALVLTDLVMPQMGGEALTRALRQRDAAVRIVVLTGHNLMDDGESLKAAGADAWLSKPPSLQSLAKVVSQTLRASRPVVVG